MLYVEDMVVEGCVGSASLYPVYDTGWSLTNKDIVGMRIASEPKLDRGMQRLIYINAAKLGRTTLRVDGLSSVWDTLSRRADPAPQTKLTADIVVIPRVGRVDLSVPVAEAEVDQPMLTRVRMYDQSGQQIPNVPIRVRTIQRDGSWTVSATDTVSVAFSKAGAGMIVAEFKDRADTVHVRIRDRVK